MKDHLVITAAVAALLGSALPLNAEDAADLTKFKSLSIDEIMNIKIPTVFGTSKHLQKISEAPSSVTIVTREEIQTYGHRTLAEILRSVRDFYVTYDRNYACIARARGAGRPSPSNWQFKDQSHEQTHEPPHSHHR